MIALGFLPPDILIIAIGTSCGFIGVFYVVINSLKKKK